MTDGYDVRTTTPGSVRVGYQLTQHFIFRSTRSTCVQYQESKRDKTIAATSPYGGGEAPGTIDISFIPSQGFKINTINCAKYGLDWPSSFQ